MYRVVRDQSHALVDHLRGRLVGAFRPDPELPCHRRKTTPLLSGTRRFDVRATKTTSVVFVFVSKL
jgi:hypothetical protein